MVQPPKAVLLEVLQGHAKASDFPYQNKVTSRWYGKSLLCHVNTGGLLVKSSMNEARLLEATTVQELQQVAQSAKVRAMCNDYIKRSLV